MSHRIRLAGPWEWCGIGDPQEPLIKKTGCQLPFTLAEDLCDAGVMLMRRFHRPTGIDDTTKMRIVLVASVQPTDVQLNGKTLPACESTDESEYCFDLTGRAEPFNQLSILLMPQTDTAATLHAVWLEILAQ